MKKIRVVILMALMSLVFYGCGNETLSNNEIEKAIEEGVLTVEDALERELIDDEQYKAYIDEREANSIPAMNKKAANLLGDFEATTKEGDVFTKDDLHQVTYFAFINPLTEIGQESYKVIEENYDSIVDAGCDVLIILTAEDEQGLMKDSTIVVIEYNESLSEALGDLTEMINLEGFSGVWNSDGAFLSAWHLNINGEQLLKVMASILEMR